MKEIVQDGASILREIAKPVPKELFGTKKLAQIIADITEALDKEPEGVALAAPQIAIPLRVFIVREDRVNPPADTQGSTLDPNSQGRTLKISPKVEVYVNPEIIKTSRRKALGEEGCLSTRGVYGAIKRHEHVTISAQHPDGKHFTRGSSGLMAQIFEHEVEHLNGELFIDNAERLIDISHADK